jgi:hypothetical protein
MSTEKQRRNLEQITSTEMPDVMKLATELYAQDLQKVQQAEERQQLVKAAEEAGLPADYLERAAAAVLSRRPPHHEAGRSPRGWIVALVGALIAGALILGLVFVSLKPVRQPISTSPATSPLPQQGSTSRAALPPAAPVSGRTMEIDLRPAISRRLDETMLGGQGNDLSDLLNGASRGRSPHRTLQGVPFRLDGIVLVGARPIANSDTGETISLSRGYRGYRGFRIGRHVKRLHFLHGIHYRATRGTQVASFIVAYEDGTRLSIPVRYGIDVVDGWAYPGTPTADTPPAWTGTNEAATRYNAGQGGQIRIQLFKRTWINPMPDQKIQTLDFVATQPPGNTAPTVPFLVAVTGEAM